MQKLTSASLFSGVGGVDLGYRNAGLEHAWGIEYDPKICEIANANFDNSIRCIDILDADPFKFEKVDLLHASPVCKQFSTANANKGERQLDIDCAKKVAEFIHVMQPQYFTLENVEAYRKSKSFHIIVERLYSLGYWVRSEVLNSADFGVPQSRRRLILLAVKNGFIPSLPLPEKHIGWYEAIADLVHDLPDSKLADWQKSKVRSIIKPFVMSSTEQRNDSIRYPDEPIFTIKANDRMPKALLENAKIKALDVACLARLQSFPDDFIWSGVKSVDGKGIGNSGCPLKFEKIARSLIGE